MLLARRLRTQVRTFWVLSPAQLLPGHPHRPSSVEDRDFRDAPKTFPASGRILQAGKVWRRAGCFGASLLLRPSSTHTQLSDSTPFSPTEGSFTCPLVTRTDMMGGRGEGCGLTAGLCCPEMSMHLVVMRYRATHSQWETETPPPRLPTTSASLSQLSLHVCLPVPTRW